MPESQWFSRWSNHNLFSRRLLFGLTCEQTTVTLQVIRLLELPSRPDTWPLEEGSTDLAQSHCKVGTVAQLQAARRKCF